jgi:hypothetical protein
MKHYRKLWIEAYGPIPVDEDGRSYEIHHIDGNRNNNALENLMCVSIQEHYDIHYKQQDWKACYKIAQRMLNNPEVLRETASILATKENEKRVREGTHPFLRRSDGSSRSKDRVLNGTHNLLGDNNPSKRRVEDGTHHLLKQNRNKEFGFTKTTAKKLANKRSEDGNLPTQTKWLCTVTKIENTKSAFTRNARKNGMDFWPHKLIKVKE